ncbi:NAD-dependent epimerase/dehydratase family protein [Pelagibacterium sp.]|uniref:NAD-dependent epimerase/dehydratase family protein n=1 Tax=Pelagibacterium sp. TaxID=1967288 RepID=UPI003A930E8C
MRFPATVVMGATGRIGRLLHFMWSADPSADRSVTWQGRVRPAWDTGEWCLCDPLIDPGPLAQRAMQAQQILCLAGVVPGQGRDLDDNIALGLAAVQAARPGARVLLASSAAVYGAAPSPLHEDNPPTPAQGYGRAKAEMEARAADLGAARGVSVCALRIGNIAGFDAALGGWRAGFGLDRFADGQTPRRSYIGVATLARVFEHLLCLPDLPPVLNIAQPAPVAMGALLDAADRSWQARPAPPSAIPEVTLDVTRLQRLLPPEALPPATATGLVAEWSAVKDAWSIAP